ncbi:LamG-like jellyroll fold domain-containing protein [Actinoplanes sp. NPDC049118]|uniref:LamG-like jellyroll fold domain-containing protein n=1 Tax=Actinoplanes sp. NPDC049118 TaxID=3155769 RepID=UPI0034060B12
MINCVSVMIDFDCYHGMARSMIDALVFPALPTHIDPGGVMWRRFLPACFAAGLVVGYVIAPHTAQAAAAACDELAGTETAAIQLAAGCGKPVAVDASRTEFSQVIAQPDGRLTFESSVVPERARRGSGWADVDLSLKPDSDGRLRPAVSVADVAFSADGTGPLATLTRAGRTMTMSWPGKLPAPTVSDSSATYANVLSDVDLVVRATETGFTHTLVIKTAAAATQSAVREIRFRLGGDAQVRSGGGMLRAFGAGSVLASTEPALMWDSRPAPAVQSPLARGTTRMQPRSTHEGAGDAARLAPVSVNLSGHDLVLRPDAKLLKDAAFPLYVDPAWSVYKAKWAYATDNGSSNTDYSSARVGKNPDTGALYRSFFQFPTTANGVALKGKHIESARVEMNLDHSWSCDSTVTSMYGTSAINATMKASWSVMKLNRFLDTASGHANQAGGCDSFQGDMKMNFSGAAVTKFAQDGATGSWTALAFGFTARADDGTGESTQNRWKKFHPNDARLFIDYDTRPTAPTYPQVATVGCTSGAVTIGTLTPTFSAVFPDADKSDSLTAAFEWIEVPAAGMGSVTDTSPTRKTAPPNKTSVTPGARATSATVTAVKNKTYAFRAKATDKTPYFQVSPWSAWCQFKVDTTVPTVTASVVTLPAGAGQKGRIRIQSTSPDVTKFQYGWDAATKPVTASGTNPKYAEVDVTAPRFGTSVLLVKAIDSTLNEGNGSVEVGVVGRPSTAVARWGLETYPGVTEPTALADRMPAPVDSPLTSANVSWTSDLRMKEGKTATFNGTSSAATTTSALVNTTGSFSVAGWVRLEALPGTDMKFATQEGPDAAGFEIGVRRSGSPLVPYWSFLMKDNSAQSGTTVAAMSPTAITAANVGRWTHVAGTFDAAEKKLRLYVDGVLVAQVDRTATPWPATGKFAVGRGFGSGAGGNFWNGSIADIQVFDRVLVALDFTGQLASDPTSGGFDEPGILTPAQVGGWNFEAAYPCFVNDLRDTCEAPDTTTAWGRWLALSRGSDIAAGRSASNQGMWLDDRYFPADDGTSAETTDEYGRSAVKTGTIPPDNDGNEFTQWQDKTVLRTDQSFTVSAWAMLGDDEGGNRAVVAQRGAHESSFCLKYDADTGKWEFVVAAQDAASTTFHGVQSSSVAEPGSWTNLVGVYDAGRKQIRIYVNGTLAGWEPLGFTPFNSTGSLLVGRTQYHDALVDQWNGGIDDVAVYQGAMNDAVTSARFDAQAADLSGANVLAVDQTLHEREALRSNSGTYQLWMQEDGNLVLYENDTAIWSTNTTANPGASLIMQGDGNLVLYSSAKTMLWSTGTYDTTADRLVLYDDGDLALLDAAGQVVWRR